MADTYKVTIANPLSFPADQRVRSGVLVTKAHGYEGELTDEQLESIEADEHLAIEKIDDLHAKTRGTPFVVSARVQAASPKNDTSKK